MVVAPSGARRSAPGRARPASARGFCDGRDSTDFRERGIGGGVTGKYTAVGRRAVRRRLARPSADIRLAAIVYKSTCDNVHIAAGAAMALSTRKPIAALLADAEHGGLRRALGP